MVVNPSFCFSNGPDHHPLWFVQVCSCRNSKNFSRDLVDTTFHAGAISRDGVTYRDTFPMSWREDTNEVERVRHAFELAHVWSIFDTSLVLSTFVNNLAWSWTQMMVSFGLSVQYAPVWKGWPSLDRVIDAPVYSGYTDLEWLEGWFDVLDLCPQ